jgi:hypothetical protein
MFRFQCISCTSFRFAMRYLFPVLHSDAPPWMHVMSCLLHLLCMSRFRCNNIISYDELCFDYPSWAVVWHCISLHWCPAFGRGTTRGTCNDQCTPTRSIYMNAWRGEGAVTERNTLQQNAPNKILRENIMVYLWYIFMNAFGVPLIRTNYKI